MFTPLAAFVGSVGWYVLLGLALVGLLLLLKVLHGRNR